MSGEDAFRPGFPSGKLAVAKRQAVSSKSGSSATISKIRSFIVNVLPDLVCSLF